MARRKKSAGGAINAEGWMMSYADMATILLAMFITLSTLGKDQTGVSLNKGLESWRASRQFFGLNGFFPNSSRAQQFQSAHPHYALEYPDVDGAEVKQTLDGEQAAFEHLLKDFDQRFSVERQPRLLGRASLDFFDSLNASAPLLTEKHRPTLNQLIPYLSQPDYQLVLIVWSPTPSESAMKRVSEKANALAREVRASLPPAAAQKLIAVAQPWSEAKHQRPVFSLVISKTEAK